MIVQGERDPIVDEKTVALLAEQLDLTENINIDYFPTSFIINNGIIDNKVLVKDKSFFGVCRR